MKAIVQDTYGRADVLRVRDLDGRRSATARCWCASTPPGSIRRLAPHERTAVPDPAGLRAAAAEDPGPRRRRRRQGRGGRRPCHPLPARRRGDGHRRGLVRRVRRRPRGEAGREAGGPDVRAGGGGPHLGDDRAAGATRAGRRRPASGCWSSGRRVASERSPCSSPRRSAPRSPACAARPRSSSSARSVPITLSTTRRSSPGDRFDLVLDIARQPTGSAPSAGAHAPWDARDRRRRGRWAVVRRHAAPAEGDRDVAVPAPAPACVRRQRDARRLATLSELIEAGRVTPVVDRTYPLEAAADAVRDLRGGGARGKFVLTV